MSNELAQANKLNHSHKPRLEQKGTIELNLVPDSDEDEETLLVYQEAKLINTHVMNQINQQKAQNTNHLNLGNTLKSQLEPPINIYRTLGHPELIWNLQYDNGYQTPNENSAQDENQ